MNTPTQSPLAHNLATLRKLHGLTLEKAAEAVGVTRQAIAKWEAGDSAPDILHCNALAALYNVALDDLVNHTPQKSGVPPPPKGKHIFGTVQVGERGQIVIPKKARETFNIQHGDVLVVLGDTNPGTAGLALVQNNEMLQALVHMTDRLGRERGDE